MNKKRQYPETRKTTFNVLILSGLPTILTNDKQAVENSSKPNIEAIYQKNKNYLLVYFKKHPIFVIPLIKILS